MVFGSKDCAIRRACDGFLEEAVRPLRAEGAGLARRAQPATTAWATWPWRPSRASGRCFIDGGGLRARPGAGKLVPGLAARRREAGAPAAGRRGRRLLRLLPVLPDHRLQGHVPGPAALRLLPGPGRRAGADRPGDGPPAVQHQHLPHLAAGPAVPLVAHNGEINTLAATSTACAPARCTWPAPLLGEDLSDLFPILAARRQRLGLLRQRAGTARPGRAEPAARHDDDDPRGLRRRRTTSAPTSGRSTSTTPPSWSRGTARRPWSSPTAGWSAARWTATACGRRGTSSPPTAWWCWPARSAWSSSRPSASSRRAGSSPGSMFLVDIEEGRIVIDNEIKSKIARQKPYRRWLEQNRIELRGLFIAAAAAVAGAPRRIFQRLRAFGYTREELRDGPDARWPSTARSRSAPWAPTRRWPCCRDRPKLLFDYFKQLFAQVTNPPIDPLREGLVMSLMSFTGQAAQPAGGDARALPPAQAAAPDPDRRRHRAAADGQPRRTSRSATIDAAVRRRGGRRRARPAQRAWSELVDRGRGGHPRRGVAADRSATATSARRVRPIPACWPRRRVHHGLLDRAAARARRGWSSRAASRAR